MGESIKGLEVLDLNDIERELLFAVLAKRAFGTYSTQYQLFDSENKLSRKKILDMLYLEFSETGLQSDYEPSEYGKRIDELMSKLSFEG